MNKGKEEAAGKRPNRGAQGKVGGPGLDMWEQGRQVTTGLSGSYRLDNGEQEKADSHELEKSEQGKAGSPGLDMGEHVKTGGHELYKMEQGKAGSAGLTTGSTERHSATGWTRGIRGS